MDALAGYAEKFYCSTACVFYGHWPMRDIEVNGFICRLHLNMEKKKPIYF